ncbi:MAG TPA: hypothetical protein VJG49_03945 [Candidatus Nanoarchaeia archaeon]|nr:hypothetical protein [Candidatus Nanoarchaeia archaeon]
MMIDVGDEKRTESEHVDSVLRIQSEELTRGELGNLLDKLLYIRSLDRGVTNHAGTILVEAAKQGSLRIFYDQLNDLVAGSTPHYSGLASGEVVDGPEAVINRLRVMYTELGLPTEKTIVVDIFELEGSRLKY